MASILNADPELDRRLGSVETVEPDEIMKKEGVLREAEQGLIVTEANQYKLGNNHELQNRHPAGAKIPSRSDRSGIEVPGGIWPA